MSYDVHFEVDVGTLYCLDSLNHTYNCSSMFREALGGKGINDLHGKRASDIEDRVYKGISDMLIFPEKYKRMNPINGWGDYYSAKEFLEKILECCKKYSKSTVRVT